MNDILSKVTPLTRGIIWLTHAEIMAGGENYKAIDYLLDGLLTAGLRARSLTTSMALLGTSFGRPLHVFIANKIEFGEYESFLRLLTKDLVQESTVLVIDETNSFNTLLNSSPSDIRSHLQLFK